MACHLRSRLMQTENDSTALQPRARKGVEDLVPGFQWGLRAGELFESTVKVEESRRSWGHPRPWRPYTTTKRDTLITH